RSTRVRRAGGWSRGGRAGGAVWGGGGEGGPWESIGPVHADVEIVIGIGPERIVGVRPEGVIDEIPIGKGPEQPAEPADNDNGTATKPSAVPVVPAVPAMPIMIPVLVCKFLACKFSLEGRMRQRTVFPHTGRGERIVAQHGGVAGTGHRAGDHVAFERRESAGTVYSGLA